MVIHLRRLLCAHLSEHAVSNVRAHLQRDCARSLEARTACINPIRGLLAGFGLVFPQSAEALGLKLPGALKDASNELGRWLG